jgi:hypothetical protein
MSHLIDAGISVLVTISAYFAVLTIGAAFEAYYTFKEHRNHDR